MGCLFAFLPGIPTDLRVETGYLILQPSAAQSKNQRAKAALGWGVGPLLFPSGTHSSSLGLVNDLLKGQSPGFHVCKLRGGGGVSCPMLGTGVTCSDGYEMAQNAHPLLSVAILAGMKIF